MFAVVEIAGVQLKIEPGMKIWVPYMETHEPGENISFDNVLLLADGKDITVGQPSIEGIEVNATVLRHTKGPKLIVFKKKRRKGYQKKRGHRQNYTVLQIEDIKT